MDVFFYLFQVSDLNICNFILFLALGISSPSPFVCLLVVIKSIKKALLTGLTQLPSCADLTVVTNCKLALALKMISFNDEWKKWCNVSE